MTMQSVNPFCFPRAWQGTGGGLTLDAEGEAWAPVIQITKDDSNLSHLVFKTYAHTTTGTLSIAGLTVDLTTGLPTTSLYHANATGTLSVSATGIHEIPFNSGTGFPVTRGDFIALCLYIATGASPVYNGGIAYCSQIGLAEERMDCPYGVMDTGGSTGAPTTSHNLTKSTDTRSVEGGLKYADGTYVRLGPGNIVSAPSGGNNFFGSGYYGNRIKFPFKCRVIGCWFDHFHDATSDMVFHILNASGSSLAASPQIDASVARGTGRTQYMMFDTAVTLEANTAYVVALEAKTGTCRVNYSDYGSNALLALSPVGSIECYKANAASVGTSPTLTNDQVLQCGVIIDQIDYTTGGGGGGLLTHPGMAGGMRG